MSAPARAAGTAVGHVVATEARPSTSHAFHFRAPNDAEVGIGAIVRVEGDGRAAWGVVTEGYAWSDYPSSASGDGGPGVPPPVAESRLFAAAVLRHRPDEPLRPVPIGRVFLAEPADLVTALRMDAFHSPEAPNGIPVGLHASTGGHAAVFLDPDFLLGPEAAHLNITGVSGLATKTSALTFVLNALFQRLPADKGSIAALCFNVKGPDLCFLDQAADLGPADRQAYERLGLRAEPFQSVRLYAPFKPDGVNLNTLRTHDALADTTEPLVWGLPEVLEYADVILHRDDVDAKADALIDFLAERVVGREFLDPALRPEPFLVRSFADLDELFQAVFRFLEERGRGAESWRTHHIATIRKIRNRLGNISTRSKGLVTDDGAANDLPWGRFVDRTVYVVDVAGLDPLAQDLVFARVVGKLREHLERRALGVEHLVVMVDELNKYAPADGPETHVRQMLLDLSERGRYLGLSLFSAQQFRSQVHRRVVGNAGTAVYGRMDGDELATAGYGTLSPAIKAKLSALPKGELMVRHPHFTQPVFVRFPRPAALTGREGVEQFPPAADLPFPRAVARRLRVLDPGIPQDVVAALAEAHREEDVRRALNRTIRERPEQPLAWFTAMLGRIVPAETPVRRSRPGVRDLDDPYA